MTTARQLDIRDDDLPPAPRSFPIADALPDTIVLTVTWTRGKSILVEYQERPG